MEIKINISKKDKEHLENCNSYLYACGVVSNIMEKIKKKLERRK